MNEVEHRTFCRFCPAVCGVVVTTVGDDVVKVTGDADHPLSRGYVCPKGRAIGLHHAHPDRLDHPLVRDHGQLVAVPWSSCLDDIEAKLRAVVAEHGADAVGVYHGTAAVMDSASRRVSERFFGQLGTRSRYSSLSVDTPCKPLVAELVGGHAGLVAHVDERRARFVLIIGSNPVVSHGHTAVMPNPVVRLRELTANGEVWVLDPRSTETTRLATRHLAPRPGTDHVVLAHLVRELLIDGADHPYLREHAQDVDVDVLTQAVAPYDATLTAARTGIDPADLADLLAVVRWAGRLAVITGTGTTMAAAANVTEWLAWALLIVTGSLDRRGGMWCNPGFLRQLDARGGEPSDGTPGPGPASRPALPERWGELPSAALVSEIEAGNVRALFVIGGSPLTALPETTRLATALASLDLLVVCDVIANDMTAMASHVLPSASQLERADLPIMVDLSQPAVATQHTAAVLPLMVDRRPGWWPFAMLAERFGLDVLPAGVTAGTCTDDDVLRVVADRSRSTFEQLRAAPSGVIDSGPIFGWVHHRLPAGRWRLAPLPLVDQLSSLRQPPRLVLTPRRQIRHLNSVLTDTGVHGARRDTPDVIVHPAEAAARNLDDGDDVVVTSAHGRLVGTVHIDPSVIRGVVSIPHGFGQTNVGELTGADDDIDGLTGMVLQSGVAVSLTRCTVRAGVDG